MDEAKLSKFVPEKTLQKAATYERDGMVKKWEILPDGAFRANVQGAVVYRVSGRITHGRLVESDCQCEAAAKSICKHIAAALIRGARISLSNSSASPKSLRAESPSIAMAAAYPPKTTTPPTPFAFDRPYTRESPPTTKRMRFQSDFNDEEQKELAQQESTMYSREKTTNHIHRARSNSNERMTLDSRARSDRDEPSAPIRTSKIVTEKEEFQTEYPIHSRWSPRSQLNHPTEHVIRNPSPLKARPPEMSRPETGLADTQRQKTVLRHDEYEVEYSKRASTSPSYHRENLFHDILDRPEQRRGSATELRNLDPYQAEKDSLFEEPYTGPSSYRQSTPHPLRGNAPVIEIQTRCKDGNKSVIETERGSSKYLPKSAMKSSATGTVADSVIEIYWERMRRPQEDGSASFEPHRQESSEHIPVRFTPSDRGYRTKKLDEYLSEEKAEELDDRRRDFHVDHRAQTRKDFSRGMDEEALDQPALSARTRRWFCADDVIVKRRNAIDSEIHNPHIRTLPVSFSSYE
eukprot:TRINITY_DN233_c0_g2_i9.p1 TRINITY_DN233_c0_g2~~TRINITY_DN233_c0_g2_i9.p1  ORF type:complete len:520 (+),score=82.63 TRINITY_DN233_c0_g2_i9:65-1624(+)